MLSLFSLQGRRGHEICPLPLVNASGSEGMWYLSYATHASGLGGLLRYFSCLFLVPLDKEGCETCLMPLMPLGWVACETCLMPLLMPLGRGACLTCLMPLVRKVCETCLMPLYREAREIRLMLLPHASGSGGKRDFFFRLFLMPLGQESIWDLSNASCSSLSQEAYKVYFMLLLIPLSREGCEICLMSPLIPLNRDKIYPYSPHPSESGGLWDMSLIGVGSAWSFFCLVSPLSLGACGICLSLESGELGDFSLTFALDSGGLWDMSLLGVRRVWRFLKRNQINELKNSPTLYVAPTIAFLLFFLTITHLCRLSKNH